LEKSLHVFDGAVHAQNLFNSPHAIIRWIYIALLYKKSVEIIIDLISARGPKNILSLEIHQASKIKMLTNRI
jgi:hypothetical protein